MGRGCSVFLDENTALLHCVQFWPMLRFVTCSKRTDFLERTYFADGAVKCLSSNRTFVMSVANVLENDVRWRIPEAGFLLSLLLSPPIAFPVFLRILFFAVSGSP